MKGVPTRADIQTLLLDNVAGFENSNLALASISQATDEAVANVEAQTKRTAAGLKPEGQDEPLMIAIQDQLAAQFRSKDSWELEPKYQPSAAMIGRIRREFERRSPTIYNLIKVRTVYTSNTGFDPKSRKLSEGITVVFEDDPEVTSVGGQITRLCHIIDKLEVLALAWAITGNYDVPFEGKQTTFCSGAEAHHC